MKKLNPEESNKLRLSHKDWTRILEGGRWTLEQGTDFDCSVSSADAAVRGILLAKMGAYRITQDAKNGTVTIRVTAPTP